MPKVATIDFHVTSECNQACPYCWGPQGYDHPVDTTTAINIITYVKQVGARRIVFTGGDPLKRPDIGVLLRHAREIGLQVALSTTGDEVTPAFLEEFGDYIDLISLPLDGATEAINARTKKPGHFDAIMRDLDWLRRHPHIDVKLCTPVTGHNLADVPNILSLAEGYAQTTLARVFYNIFQAFPRSMSPQSWDGILVSAEEFTALKQQVAGRQRIHVNFLDHATLDRLYVMIFPDGNLVVASGPHYLSYGPFLQIEDLDAVLASSPFDDARHLLHSLGWEKA